jgi:hypothetical protein
MPMLFYLPMILWLGLMGIAKEELRPIRVKIRE